MVLFLTFSCQMTLKKRIEFSSPGFQTSHFLDHCTLLVSFKHQSNYNENLEQYLQIKTKIWVSYPDVCEFPSY